MSDCNYSINLIHTNCSNDTHCLLVLQSWVAFLCHLILVLYLLNFVLYEENVISLSKKEF